MSTIHVVCPHCHKVNRIPVKEHYTKANCGYCKGSLLDTHPVELTPETFAIHIQKSDIPVVVDFWAPWCGPCRMMAPAYEEAAAQFPLKAQFAKVNTEQYQQLAAPFGIRGIPTIIVFKNGQEMERVSGALPAQQIAQLVARHLG
ncbi:thioredoxin TrxC [Hydrogenimonas urashimensis]|uniref:thioredoxin TrxC n=1 Tax=Hydrogenimonas urashimensis TaxID=2740515 RepID=UPI0019163EE6|nr:thioredoxin TrxC [Hydrogenimonas urashimensis]